MRIYLISLCLGLLLASCAPRHLGSFSAEGITPKQETVIAEDAAGKLANAYPPGRTALHLELSKSGHFNAALESRLRERGFRLEAAGGSGVLSVAYTLDAIKDEPGVWYLNVKASDGFSFSRVYALGPETKPDGGMVQTASPEKGEASESGNPPEDKALPQ
jgi:hypothetical protein